MRQDKRDCSKNINKYKYIRVNMPNDNVSTLIISEIRKFQVGSHSSAAYVS